MSLFYFFFFNDPATTEIYTLSLHDALPILVGCAVAGPAAVAGRIEGPGDLPVAQAGLAGGFGQRRSEEHTSELQSQSNLVCRLLLVKKKDHDRAFTDASRQILTLPLIISAD